MRRRPLIVQEAGGRTNDCLPGETALINGGPIIAATAAVYDKLLAVIDG